MTKRNKLENLKSYKPMRAVALAFKPLCVKVDQDIDQAIRALPQPSTWLRDVIENAAIAQELVKNNSSSERVTELKENLGK